MSQASLPFLPAEYAYEFVDSGVMRGGATARPTDHCWAIPKEYYINDDRIADSFSHGLAPISSDLLDVALATYVADRLSPRVGVRKSRRLRNWKRVIHLTVSVRRLEIWKRSDVVESLAHVLQFFTDDVWQLNFVRRRAPGRLSETQNYLFANPLPKPVGVALFSGGLDSFCGAVQQMSECSRHSFAFVSGVTNSRQRFEQREQIKAISREVGRQVCHVTIPFGLKWHGKSSRGFGEEASQRTRGFLFLTLGAVTAIAAGASELSIFENGIGAINLPYDASQVGSFNSRAVHPLALLRMGEFLTTLRGKEFVFQSPFLFQTKGEMCCHPTVQSLSAYIPRTFSCDGFPVHARKKPQCGSCTSCLLRRLSLQSAGLSKFDPANGYVADLSNSKSKVSERQLRHLRVMEWQYHKIKQSVLSEAPWQNLISEFPELQNFCAEMTCRSRSSEDEIQRSLLKLYSRYVAEWDNFSARELLVFNRAA
jgi:7-cyano-7-deazaguanine synthase in queuosine biosynthesis